MAGSDSDRLGSGRRAWLLALGWMAAASAAWPPTIATAAPSTEQLLDMSFDDLLQVEIRSAGKRDERIRDVPASVTIVTRDDIERYGWVTFEELLRNVPGFYLLDNLEDRFIGTRGTVGGGVQILVNGIPQHPSLQKTLTGTEIARLDIPVESIDRVEVIRGPMSVVYGNNAFQGVINVVTNRIDRAGSRVSGSLGGNHSGKLFGRIGSEFEGGFAVLNLGGYKTNGLSGAYADMLGPDQVGILDPAMHPDMDGDMDQKTASLDFSAQWRGWEANLRYNWRDYGIYAFTPPFDEGTRVRLDTWHASLSHSHNFSDDLGLKLTGIVSTEDYDAYQFDFLSPEVQGDQQQASRRWELESDLHWRPSVDFDALAGYRFLRIDRAENRVNLSPLIVAHDELESFNTHDLFAQVNWRVAAPLRLVGGVRVTLLPDQYRRSRQRGGGAAVNQTVAVDDNVQVNGQFALLWSPTPDQVVKLSWGSAAQDTDNFLLPESERIETLEVGYTLGRAHWQVGASLFQNRSSHLTRTIQTVDPGTGVYLTQTDNSGRWRSRGLELIAQLRPVERLNLSASLTWQHTEDEQTDIDPGYSPGLLAKLKADWRRGPFTAAAFAYYVGSMQADWDFVGGTEQGVVERIGASAPSYWDLGLNLRWDPPGAGPWAALHLSNLLDTEVRYPANELTDFQRGLIGPGRVVTATVGWVF